jgi:hypothetical protein
MLLSSVPGLKTKRVYRLGLALRRIDFCGQTNSRDIDQQRSVIQGVNKEAFHHPQVCHKHSFFRLTLDGPHQPLTDNKRDGINKPS